MRYLLYLRRFDEPIISLFSIIIAIYDTPSFILGMKNNRNLDFLTKNITKNATYNFKGRDAASARIQFPNIKFIRKKKQK